MNPVRSGDLVRHKETGRYFIVTSRWGWPNNPNKPTYLKLAGKSLNKYIQPFREKDFEVICENE